MSAAKRPDYPSLIAKLFKEEMLETLHFRRCHAGKAVLLKAGAEHILLRLGLTADPTMTTERLPNGHTSYQCRTQVKREEGDRCLVVGLGEGSTAEDWLAWKEAPHQKAYDAAPNHAKQSIYNAHSEVPVLQLRTNPADCCNAAMESAKTRALISAAHALGGTAIFAMDDQSMLSGTSAPQQKLPKHLSVHAVGVIRHALVRHGGTEEDLCKKFKIKSLNQLPYRKLDEAMLYISGHHP